MNIGPLNVRSERGQLRLEAAVSSASGCRVCFFETPEEFGGLVDETASDAFLLAFLMPAMVAGEDLHIGGKASELLLCNLNETVIPILNCFNPLYRKIQVDAAEPVARTLPGGRGVATGFSGGVDSFACLYEHFGRPVFPSRKLTHLFFFNVGAHGMARTDKELAAVEQVFRARYEEKRAIAAELGLPLIPVNSNVHSFYPVGHLESCSLVTPAAALLFEKGIGTYYLASGGHNFADKARQLGVNRESVNLADLDPLVLPYLSTESLRVWSTENRFRRSDKTALIADYPPARRHLQVCNKIEIGNCSVCEKCCRTISTLEILGKAAAFAGVFDFDRYHREAEKEFLGRVFAMAAHKEYYADLVNMAKARGIDLRKRTTRAAIFRARFYGTDLHKSLRSLPGLRPAIRALKRLAGR